MKNADYYYCTVCGNVIEKLHDSGQIPMCCMREMEELIPGTTDGKTEWHVPVYEKCKNKLKVSVGKNLHPMESNHYIEWIDVITDKRSYRKRFSPGEEPVAHFHLCSDETLVSIMCYCNLHKLWKTDCAEGCTSEYSRYTDD